MPNAASAVLNNPSLRGAIDAYNAPSAAERVIANPYLRRAIQGYVPASETFMGFYPPGSALAAAGSALLANRVQRLYGPVKKKRKHNLSNNMSLPFNSIGSSIIAGGPGDRNRRRKRARRDMTPNSSATNKTPTSTSSSNMSSLTTKSVSTALKVVTNNAELDASKRATPAKYRLHAAKYLKMDPMLKELFFQLHRFKGFFGFMSTSGQGLATAVPMPANSVGKLAPRSAFRGISFFKLRHTAPRYVTNYPAPDDDDDQAKVLNAARVKIGTTDYTDNGTTQDIRTYFRRFNNAPQLIQGAGAVGPPDTSPEGVLTMSADLGSYRQLAMDFNCSDIESAALAAQAFSANLTATTDDGGSFPGGMIPGADTPAIGPKPYEESTDVSALKTNNIYKDAVVRIADGKLSMDIANGSRVPTVVEVVIHSMKKNTPGSSKRMNTTAIYEQLWRAASWSKSEATNFEGGFTGSVSPQQGGWNAFWDPKTPFLKVSGPGKKMVDDIANEVHRSVHYLGPGEQKTVDIALGSLYYKLGYRSGFYDPLVLGNNPADIDVLTDGPGTLAVAIGHFGIDCMETAFNDQVPFDLNRSGNTAAQEGMGFWVGKRPAPSQIVVSGQYEESWYPAYYQGRGRQIASQSALGAHLNSYQSVPLGTIAPEQVSTIDGDSFFESVGAGKAVEASQA